jgi:hypothetical protein
MKEVKCLGCDQTYLISEQTITRITKQELSPEGYCARVRQRIGFSYFTKNGVSA